MLEVIEQQAQQVGAAGGLVFAPDPQVTIAPDPEHQPGQRFRRAEQHRGVGRQTLVPAFTGAGLEERIERIIGLLRGPVCLIDDEDIHRQIAGPGAQAFACRVFAGEMQQAQAWCPGRFRQIVQQVALCLGHQGVQHRLAVRLPAERLADGFDGFAPVVARRMLRAVESAVQLLDNEADVFTQRL